MMRSVPQGSRIKVWLLVVLLLVLAVVGSVSYLGWRQSVPGVHATVTAPRFLGHKPSFTVVVETTRGNVVRADVRIVQGGKPVIVARQDTPGGPHVEIPVAIETAALGLREGPATIEVWGRDDFWRPVKFSDRRGASVPVTIDLTPPKLEVMGATRYVSPGGAAVVAFRATDAVRTEVKVGARTFPSFAYGPPERGARVALIALPYDFAGGALSIVAQDEAGNTATRAIPGELKPRKFPRDRIQLRDPFLQTKVEELLPQRPPSQPLLDAFLVINRDQRKQAEQEKLKVGTQTADTPLWSGPFEQPRNTKVFSNFAETRTYIYEGREVDTQVHYGYDLASTKQSPIPAANAGVVAFAGPLTIYGNAVILDHGLGLQTLYGHLSSIDVKPGDKIDKGQELGRSGNTGLALGDHLHFEVLVSGVSVTPLEWWDAKWIRDRINRPLKEAGLPEIGGVGAVPDDEETAAKPAPRHARRRAR
jgi:murein DD-endopeptidase MepM/ murein hydrolase activator NlpD